MSDVSDPGELIAAFVAAVRKRLRLEQRWRGIGIGGAVALNVLTILMFGAALTSAKPPPSTSSEPIVGDIDLTLTYPAYTQLPPRAIPGSSGHILALPGTRVAVTARALAASTREASLLIEAEGAEPRELP